ncbi:hypothetical protein [Streptomyces sp. BH055]|uniref:hypothetical protein n=1 Tax=Streptomyces sp. BH055 TaxID=3401173 RepID=UPI003BB639FE
MEERPGWCGELVLALVVPGLLFVGVLGRGVEGVVDSGRRVGVGVVRWGASVRGVSVRGFVVGFVGLGWRDGPWVGVVGVFVTGPGVAVAAGVTFGVWFGAGAAGFWSPVGVGVAVGAGRFGVWASVAVALCVWNVGLDDVREDVSGPVWAPAPAPAPGMEPGVVAVGAGDEVSVGVGVPAGVAAVMGCWTWVRGSVAVDGSLPRSGEGVCAAGPLDSCVGTALSEAVLMLWDGSDCPTDGAASGVEAGAGDGVVASASTRACGTEEGWWSDCAADAGVAASLPLRCESVPVDTSGVPDDGAASGVLCAPGEPGEESGVLDGPVEPPPWEEDEDPDASRCSL